MTIYMIKFTDETSRQQVQDFASHDYYTTCSGDAVVSFSSKDRRKKKQYQVLSQGPAIILLPRSHCKCSMGCCCSKVPVPKSSCACSICCFWPKFCGSDSVQNHHEVQCSSRNVHHVTTMQSWEAKLAQASRDGKIVVANFSASWSHPCRDIVPTYSELAKKYSCLVFLSVDADELAELSTSLDITATPTFYFLKDGRVVDKLVGADKSELQRKTVAVADFATKSCN